MAIFVPQKINVGFQTRKDTYSGKLAYVIYFDEKGKLRKETSWQNWRNKDIPNEIYDNEPIEGFVLNKKVGGVEGCYRYDARKTYVRVYDPRGFEFEITIPNLLWILQNCDCTKGKGLEGQFVYGWAGAELVLVPTESPDYKDIIEKNNIIHNNTFIKARELVCGATYEDLNGNKYVYMGKFKPWDKLYNCYQKEYCRNIVVEKYCYPLDDSWKESIFDKYEKYPDYHKWVQREKAEFFFVVLKNPNAGYSFQNHVTFMKSVSRKFTKMVAETTEYYLEYIDLLNHYDKFSPIDYDTEQIISLPYENFEAAGNRYDRLRIGIEKNGHLSRVWYYYDYGENKFYEAHEKHCVRKEFYSIKELYEKINPVYGIQYLVNGQENRREYYYDTDGTKK